MSKLYCAFITHDNTLSEKINQVVLRTLNPKILYNCGAIIVNVMQAQGNDEPFYNTSFAEALIKLLSILTNQELLQKLSVIKMKHFSSSSHQSEGLNH